MFIRCLLAALLVSACGRGQYTIETVGGTQPANLIRAVGFALDGTAYYSAAGRIWRQSRFSAPVAIAGNGVEGEGCVPSPGPIAAADATVCAVTGIAVHTNQRDLYFMDRGRIRVLSNGQVTTLGVDPVRSFQFAEPMVAHAGFLYVFRHSRIEKISMSSGQSTVVVAVDDARQIAFDPAGNLHFSDVATVRRVDAGGNTVTVAGSVPGWNVGDGGPATAAKLGPSGIAFDAQGNLFVTDYDRVRVVNPAGVIRTYSYLQYPPNTVESLKPYAQLVYTAGEELIARVGGPYDPLIVRVRADGPAQELSQLRVPMDTPSKLANIRSIAAAPEKRLYVSDGFSVYRADFARNLVETLYTAPGTDYIGSIASTANGDLYMNARSGIQRLTAAGTLQTLAPQFRTNLLGPIACDGNGNVYVGIGNDVYRRGPDGRLMPYVHGAFALNLAADASGVLYLRTFQGLFRFTETAGLEMLVIGADTTLGDMAVRPDGSLLFTQADASSRDWTLMQFARSGSVALAGGPVWHQSNGDGGPADLAQFFDPIQDIETDASGGIYVLEGGRIRLLTPQCAYSISPQVAELGEAGGKGSFVVRPVGGSNCRWAARSKSNWLTLDGATTGAGEAQITYTLNREGNALAGTREHYVSVNGSRFLVRQRGTCTVSLSVSSILATRSGSLTTVGVTPSRPDCVYGYQGDSWLNVYSVGPGQIAVSVPARTNLQFPRTGQVTIGDKQISVTQAATDSAADCEMRPDISVAPGSGTVPSAGVKNASFGITATSGCRWSATSDRRWLQVFPLGGTGNGVLQYSVEPNYSTAVRMGTIVAGGKSFIVSQAPATGTLEQRFVGQLYYALLGRVPSAAEVAWHHNSLIDRRNTLASLALSFFQAPEFSYGGRFVGGLYVGLLMRDAEYSGWLWQRRALESPDSLIMVTRNFLFSAERALRLPQEDAATFVRTLYLDILARAPNPTEVEFHAAPLRVLSGAAHENRRAEVAMSFLLSDEFRLRMDRRLTSFLLYATLLQREGNAAERGVIEAQLEAGTPLQTIIGRIVASAEFQALLN